MREVISTKDAPQAIGPYSQAIKANGFVFTSGQIALDPLRSKSSPETSPRKPSACCATCPKFSRPPASGLGKVVRSTVFLKNMNDFAAMNQVYGKYFSSAPPARSTVEVAACRRMSWWKSTLSHWRENY